MEVKIKKRSWHVIIYKMFYGSSPSDNLCPYFWKSLVSVTFFIPVMLLAIPENLIRVSRYFDRKKKDDSVKFENVYLTSDKAEFLAVRTIANLIGWLFLIFIFALFYNSFNFLTGKDPGILLWQIVAILMVAGLALKNWFTEKYYDPWKEKRWIAKRKKEVEEPVTQKGDSYFKILIKWSKAKYNQYCPKIDWIE